MTTLHLIYLHDTDEVWEMEISIRHDRNGGRVQDERKGRETCGHGLTGRCEQMWGGAG